MEATADLQSQKNISQESERAQILAREKRKALIQTERDRGYLENLNRSPQTMTPEEQFASLRKGDIGEIAGQENISPAKSDDYDGTASENRPGLSPAIREQEAAGGGYAPIPPSATSVSDSKKNIRSLDKGIKTDQKQIQDLERVLRPVQAVAFASQISDTIRAIKLWLKLVAASFITVIGGIFMVLASFIVIPLLFVLGIAGALPDSPKTKKIKTQANQLKKQIAEWQEKMANKNKLKQLEYQRLAQTK